MRTLIIIASAILATSAFPQRAPAQRQGSEGSSHAPASPPKNAVRATRDPNYVKKAEQACDCTKIGKVIPGVPVNNENLAPAQKEGKASAPAKPLKNVVRATRDPNYCNCQSSKEEEEETNRNDYVYEV